MKLKRAMTYESSKGRRFYRWDVSLPPALIDAKGWKKGTELEAIDHKDGILLRRKG
jgi:hypothetical protein